jgi:HSP20 family protein
MAIVKWNDPFGSMVPRTSFDDLFSGFWGTGVHGGHGVPAMDVYTDDDKALVAEVQAPGFTKDDITVDVHDGLLEIKGEKHQKTEDKDKEKRNYMVRESHESFYRSVALPKVADEGNVKATFENGMLKVVVPFKELPAPKRVSITDGTAKK